jgi:non-heme chloroperoxidase
MSYFTNRTGHRLFFHDWGTGKPMVFIHGGALNANCWEYQTVALSEQGYRCIAADTRGCGRSDEPGSGYDYDTLADDVADLLDFLDLGDITLIGHSMGAGTITSYLTRYGTERVGRCVLIGPTTPYMLLADDNPNGVPAQMFEDSVALLRVNRPMSIDIAAPAFFGGDPTDPAYPASLIEWGKGLALGSGAKATMELFGSFYKTDFRPDMKSFTIPTLILHGDADMTAPLPITGQPTAAAIAGSELRLYPGGSHGIMMSHASQLNADIEAFVKANP